jgi:hypothetical protein
VWLRQFHRITSLRQRSDARSRNPSSRRPSLAARVTILAGKIDTMAALERFAQELIESPSGYRRAFILAVLERWQDDGDLTMPSRQRARELLRRFSQR